MKVFALKTCDSSRKAIAALRAAGHTPEVQDVRDAPLSADQLALFLETFGDALVNRASTTWRGLSASERALPPAELLAKHPTLMKRPVIEAGGRLYLGWKADVQSALLG